MAVLLKNSRYRFLAIATVIAALTALTFSLLAETQPLQWLENGSYDQRARAYAQREEDRQQPTPYVIIDIDNASLDTFKPIFGRWPWSRQVWTEVARYVSRGQPKVLGMDIIFGGEEKPEVDREFESVIARSGKVVLAFSYTQTEMEVNEAEGARQHAGRALVAREARPPRPEVAAKAIDLAKYSAVNVPFAPLANAAAGLGAINTWPDRADGVNRRTALHYLVEGRWYPSLALRMAEIAGGRADADANTPVDAAGYFIPVWTSHRMTAQRVSFANVICSIYPDNCDAAIKKVPPEFFRDKIVLLGASAASSYEAIQTPMSAQAPGFTLHMTVVQNLLEGRGVSLPPAWVRPLVITLMAMVGAATLVALPSAVGGTIAALSLGAIYAAICHVTFLRSQQWLPMMAPLLALAVAFVGTGLARYATTGRELRRTRGTLDRYISPQLVQYVLEHRDSINLAGEKRELTILFSDVRSFTTITEGSDPMELIRTLNEYLAEMTDVIFKYDGITDKFIGDGILAYWGAFTPGKNHALLACQAALEMHERLDRLNTGWRAEGRQPLAIGIGINTGEVVFGNVGSGRKIEFTVIGDPVNLAARLESQTKDFGVKVLISEYTVQRAGEQVVARALGGVKVKGKTVETQVFELQSVQAAAANDSRSRATIPS